MKEEETKAVRQLLDLAAAKVVIATQIALLKRPENAGASEEQAALAAKRVIAVVSALPEFMEKLAEKEDIDSVSAVSTALLAMGATLRGLMAEALAADGTRG